MQPYVSYSHPPKAPYCVAPPRRTNAYCLRQRALSKTFGVSLYTARRAIVQEFTPTDEERELSRLVADYLRRPNLQALPEGQRQLISLVLWKLLASSSRAIAGALATMAQRLQTLLAALDKAFAELERLGAAKKAISYRMINALSMNK